MIYANALVTQRSLLFMGQNSRFLQGSSGNLYFASDDFPEFNRPSPMNSFMARQNAAASLLEKYGAKHGVRQNSNPGMRGPLR
jgi:hypothetical protein